MLQGPSPYQTSYSQEPQSPGVAQAAPKAAVVGKLDEVTTKALQTITSQVSSLVQALARNEKPVQIAALQQQLGVALAQQLSQILTNRDLFQQGLARRARTVAEMTQEEKERLGHIFVEAPSGSDSPQEDGGEQGSGRQESQEDEEPSA